MSRRLNRCFLVGVSFVAGLIFYLIFPKIVSAACTCTGTVQLYTLKCSANGAYCAAGTEGQPCFGGLGTCQRSDLGSSQCSNCGDPGGCYPFCQQGVGFIGYTGSCWRCTSTPPPSGGGCSSDYCAGPAQCASQGGTTGGSGPRPSGGNCTGGTVMCCISGGGGGGGGGGGDPCPGDTCAGYCCNYTCGQPCIVSQDCKNPSAGGQPTYCNPTTHTCVNSICPNNTVPGANCTCNGGTFCGQRCAGPCDSTSNSTCRYTNSPGGSCTDGTSTYCIGDTGNGINTYNPSYTTPKCLAGDTGNSYLLGPGGQSTGFTQAQINSTCKPGAWWQVKDGDVVTNGRIQSVIPIACTLPSCNPYFNLNGLGGYPGIVMYGSSIAPVFTASGGSGKVSTKGWLANTTYNGKTYNYSYFEGLVPSTVTVNEIATDTINGNYFQVNGTPSPITLSGLGVLET